MNVLIMLAFIPESCSTKEEKKQKKHDLLMKKMAEYIFSYCFNKKAQAGTFSILSLAY